MEWLARFQQIDRRIIYLLVILSVAFALLVPFELPQPVTPEVHSFYEAVEAVPDDKIVLVAADWGAATRGECYPQTEAVVRHLFQAKKRFAILGFDVQGPEFTQSIAEKLAPEFGAKYGEDWVNWGYKTAGAVEDTLLGLAQSITDTIPQDINGTPLSELPVMKGIETLRDVALIAEFTGAGFLDAYLRMVPKGVLIAQGCTAVIGPEQYTYLDSGQLVGLLVGMRGAAEYEALLGVKGQGREAMRPQSLTHLLAILLIALGNLAVLAQRHSTQGARRR